MLRGDPESVVYHNTLGIFLNESIKCVYAIQTKACSYNFTTPLLREWIYHNREVADMRGYNTETGYYGWVDGEYILFACEADYRDAVEEE